MGSLLRANKRSASFAEKQLGAAAGQPWAVDALVDDFLPRLASFARARGAADPEGIAHVTLLSVLRRLPEMHFEAEQQLWAYLCRTARSRIIDEFRATKPVELFGDSAPDPLGLEQPLPSLAPFDERMVERDYVDGLLSPLTTDQRQVLELRFIDDLSIAETANLTGRSPEAVKGLQRRAINAILAAAVLIIVLVTVRLAGFDGESNRTTNAPADSVAETEGDVSNPDIRSSADEEGLSLSPNQQDVGGLPGPTVGPEGPTETAADPESATVDGGDGEQASDSASTGDVADRFTITEGTARSTALDASGQPVSSDLHGTRIYCTVSHISHGDPITGGGPAGLTANLYWGNTGADRSAAAAELPVSGNGTCEGGTSDRSAYWMPALFDEAGRAVLPEMVLVEYKTFGPPGFDRTAVRAIPPGLQLVVDPALRAGDPGTGSGGGQQRTSLVIRFPECIAVDGTGNPILSSPDHASHLADADASTATGCPDSHPHRIPQVTYKLEYAVPFDSGWSLATGHRRGSGPDGLTAGFIAGWDPTAMDLLVRCTIELIDHCEFADVADGRRFGRAQLPERFDGPDGAAVYVGSTTLAPGADRTPFGSSVPARL